MGLEEEVLEEISLLECKLREYIDSLKWISDSDITFQLFEIDEDNLSLNSRNYVHYTLFINKLKEKIINTKKLSYPKNVYTLALILVELSTFEERIINLVKADKIISKLYFITEQKKLDPSIVNELLSLIDKIKRSFIDNDIDTFEKLIKNAKEKIYTLSRELTASQERISLSSDIMISKKIESKIEGKKEDERGFERVLG